MALIPQVVADTFEHTARSIMNIFTYLLHLPPALWGWLKQPRDGERRYNCLQNWTSFAVLGIIGVTFAILSWYTGRASEWLTKQSIELARQSDMLTVKQMCMNKVRTVSSCSDGNSAISCGSISHFEINTAAMLSVTTCTWTGSYHSETGSLLERGRSEFG